MIVTLLTDFGLSDSYVAEVKAAVLSRAAGARFIDISHDVPPGNIPAAQYLLDRSWRRFPKGTTHLVVVDPGVGTSRRAIAASVAGHHFVAPDNGVLSPVLSGAAVVELPVAELAAPTFHGRDLFAPAAGQLAGGTPLRDLGSPCRDPLIQPLPQARREGGQVVGLVIYVDHYGNLISNIPLDMLDGAASVRVGNPVVGPIRATFADVRSGDLVAYRGSGGTLEVAVRNGSAAVVLQVGAGTEVRVAAI